VAFAREDFLGPGPWQIVRWGGGYRATPDADPVYLYTDDVIGILPERHLNNGQPSLHAALIAAATPEPGEHVVHIDAGVGYYTAILAELVGGGRLSEPRRAPRGGIPNRAHVARVRGTARKLLSLPVPAVEMSGTPL
jgi:protein-L-isoaspartate(D-aspartate) O-methyltransferase